MYSDNIMVLAESFLYNDSILESSLKDTMLSGVVNYKDLVANIKTIDNPHDGTSKAVKIVFHDKSNNKIGEVCISSADTNNGFVYDLEVVKKYRGRGYGRKIMNFVLDNYKIKDLTVDPINQVAIKLYKSLGFKVKQLWNDPTTGKDVYWMVY